MTIRYQCRCVVEIDGNGNPTHETGCIVAERDSLKARLQAAIDYAAEGLALQQALGAIEGAQLEALGVYMEWEMACLRHGQFMEKVEASHGHLPTRGLWGTQPRHSITDLQQELEEQERIAAGLAAALRATQGEIMRYCVPAEDRHTALCRHVAEALRAWEARAHG